jgi:hypothetical protein
MRLGTIFLLASCAVHGYRAEAAVQKQWSVDLTEYGYHRRTSTQAYSSEVRVAGTNKVIAVAIGNIPPAIQGDSNWRPWNSPLDVHLLLFSAESGKFQTRRGPWRTDSSFELQATGDGGFLLLLRHFHDKEKNPGETLYLLSALGEERKKLELEPSIISGKPDWNTYHVSGSGRTVLLGRRSGDEMRYQLLDALKLEVRNEWMAAPEDKLCGIAAISDREAVGVKNADPGESPSRPAKEQPLCVRAFGGPWRMMPERVDAAHYGLLEPVNSPSYIAMTGESIVVIHARPKEQEPAIRVMRTDGSSVSTAVIPKLQENTWLSGPVEGSDNGQYFAVGFMHRPWLSHLMLDEMQMDMTFWNDELIFLIWRIPSAEPVARIELGSDVSAMGFVGDDPPAFLYVHGTTLRLLCIRPPIAH